LGLRKEKMVEIGEMAQMQPTIAEIRAARAFSATMKLGDMPSEKAIDVLLSRIDELETALKDARSFLEEEQLTIGAGFSAIYTEICATLAFQDTTAK